jgi:carbon monoxide dehydrogenase subunit G
MQRADRTVLANLPPDRVWGFIEKMSNWAPLMPGYMRHEEVNDRQSIWTLQINIGPFSKPVIIDVDVDEWIEPREVMFRMKGRFEPFYGSGRCGLTHEGSWTAAHIVLELQITGSMQKIYSKLSEPVLQRFADHFTASFKRALSSESSPVPEAHPDPQRSRRGILARLWTYLRTLIST